MNRAFLIILVPAVLVAAGYIVVLRSLGISPGYPRLIVAVILLFAAMCWLSRKTAGKTKTERQ